MILSVGTKVVLQNDLKTIGGKSIKMTGSVGTIRVSPRDNAHRYRIGFIDEMEVMATREQIAILKHFQNIDFGQNQNVINKYNLFNHVILKCIVGSRAYGLDHEKSDVDRRGIYQSPAQLHWSLEAVPGQLEIKETDECYWELEKFITLALKANPNVLEVLYTPIVEEASGAGQIILDHREYFLSKLVYQTYSRYVLSQFKKMTNRVERGDDIPWKPAMHLIRLLLCGITILEEGFVPVRVEEHRKTLCEIRDGLIPWIEIDKWRKDLQIKIDLAHERTTLADRPNYNAIDKILIDARRSYVA